MGTVCSAVHTTAVKCWRYRIAWLENRFARGQYPAISLQAARADRGRARDLIKQGIHRACDRRAQKRVTSKNAVTTFEPVAKQWSGQNRGGGSACYHHTEGLARNSVSQLHMDCRPFAAAATALDALGIGVLEASTGLQAALAVAVVSGRRVVSAASVDSPARHGF